MQAGSSSRNSRSFAPLRITALMQLFMQFLMRLFMGMMARFAG
jgi:hypothetical protein